MTDIREATDTLLAEKPNVESDLREVLTVDEQADGWTFDDVPLDSGTFGELVSRDIVSKDGNTYEITDRNAVRAALGDTSDAAETKSEPVDRPSLSSLSLPSVSREESGALGVVLGFVLLMRTYIYPTVFRGEYVVLPSNDPYYYRYWVEQLAADATGVLDFSVLSELPTLVAKGEPLMVATLWWVTNLLGAEASGVVLAWYPVVSALVVSLLVYGLALRVTGDRRVALASVAFLAVIPAFAYRTGLGFADHHAFDYPWLALTAFALVLLSDVERTELSTLKPWLTATVLGVAVAGQVMSWDASPIVITGVGVYAAVQAVADVRADRSLVSSSAPLAAGLGLASVLSAFAHASFGWQTAVVSYSPALLLVGMIVVTTVGEAVRRAEMPGFLLGTGEVAGALAGLVLLQVFLPVFWSRLAEQINRLVLTSGPAETRSIFSGGPSGVILGPILEFGFVWVLAVPVLVAVSLRAYRQNQRAWLVVCSYSWYFLLLATFQRRFVGELAPFLAVLAGYGFLVLLAKLDITEGSESDGRGARSKDDNRASRRSFGVPDRGTISAIAILFLFVTSAGAVQTAVRHEQVEIADDKFQASVWMNGYADERGLEYPESYVLSKWGRNRVYNYFVNGEAESYRYAEKHYEAFLSSPNPESKYHQLKDRVGFVVTKDLDVNRIPPASNHARLHQRFGSRGNGASGAGHYRAVYASDDESVKVFTLVPGAKIVGNASPGETVQISKVVEIEGKQFTYKRKVKANPYGVFSVTVPYAGEYSVKGATKAVSKGAPERGKLVKWHNRDGVVRWPFENVKNGMAYDAVGGHRATFNGSVSTVQGVQGQGISFNGSNASVTTRVTAPQQFSISLWVNPDQLDAPDENDYKHLVRSKTGYLLILTERGEISFRVPGVDSTNFVAGNVPAGEWSHVTATYNGSHRTVYIDGKRVRTERIGEGTVDWGRQLRFGRGDNAGSIHNFQGSIDSVRIDDRALSPSEVRQRYEAGNETDG